MQHSVTVTDYGAGNLKSVCKAFEYLGASVTVTSDPKVAGESDRLVIPGVGAFGSGMKSLVEKGLDDAIKSVVEAGRPVLGICLGLQVLFDVGEEGGWQPGLGLIPGKVVRFPDIDGLIVPHMGWNCIRIVKREPLFRWVPEQPQVYFIHSYYPSPDREEIVSATCYYGLEFPCAISYNNLYGTQFHPEKSGRIGLAILGSFLKV